MEDKEIEFQKTYNPKIYLSLGEVLSHYLSKPPHSSIYFYDHVLSTVLTNKDGKLEFTKDTGRTSYEPHYTFTLDLGDGQVVELVRGPNKYLYWEVFIKTEEVVHLLDNLSKLPVRFKDEVSLVSKFIKGYDKPWISHKFGGAPKTDRITNDLNRNFYLGEERGGSEKGLLGRNITGVLRNLEEAGLVATVFSNGSLFNNSNLKELSRFRKYSLDFTLDGSEERFSEISYKSGEIFSNTFDRIFIESTIYQEKAISVIEPQGKEFGQTEVVLFKPNTYYPDLSTEKKYLMEIGVLPLYPEFVLVRSDKEEYPGLLLCLLGTKPTTAELGLLYLGAKRSRESDQYLLHFLPFFALKSDILLRAQGFYYKSYSEEPTQIEKSRYLPVITVSKAEIKERGEPKGVPGSEPRFQVFTFSHALTLLLYDENDNSKRDVVREVFLYSPIFESVSFFGKGEDEEPVIYRGSFVDSVDLKRYLPYSYPVSDHSKQYKDLYTKLFKNLVSQRTISSLLKSGVRKVGFDLLSLKKAEKAVRVAGETSEYYRSEEEERFPVDLEKAEEGIEEHNPLEVPLCFLSKEGFRVEVSPIGKLPEAPKKVSKIGIPLIGNAKFSSYLDSAVQSNLEVPASSPLSLYWYIRSFLDGAFDLKLGGWVKDVYDSLERVSRFMEYFGAYNRVDERVDTEKSGEVEKILETIRSKYRKAPIDAATLVLESFKEISNLLGDDISMTLVVEYTPVVKKGHEVYYEEGDPGYRLRNGPFFLKKAEEEGHVPKSIEIYSVLKSIFLIFDLKEEGIRLVVGASPTAGTLEFF